MVSLIQPPPKDKLCKIRFCVVLQLLNKYNAKGFGRERIHVMTSSMSVSYTHLKTTVYHEHDKII